MIRSFTLIEKFYAVQYMFARSPACVRRQVFMNPVIKETHGKQFSRGMPITIAVPANTEATVYVPAKEAGTVTVNGKALGKADHVTFLRMENDRAVVTVSSGDYTITSNTK